MFKILIYTVFSISFVVLIGSLIFTIYIKSIRGSYYKEDEIFNIRLISGTICALVFFVIIFYEIGTVPKYVEQDISLRYAECITTNSYSQEGLERAKEACKYITPTTSEGVGK